MFPQMFQLLAFPNKELAAMLRFFLLPTGQKWIVGDMNAPAGEETAQAITDAGGTAIFVNIDVSIESEVEQAVQTAETHFGKLTTVFNNAGNVTGTALQRGDKKPIAALID